MAGGNAMQDLSTIGELTREFGISTRTLRFYEGEGLINPVRRGLRRLYPPRECARLMLILRAKRLGYSLSEIAEILDLCGREPEQERALRHVIARIRECRAELDRKRSDIEAMLDEFGRAETRLHSRLAARDGTGKEGGAGKI